MDPETGGKVLTKLVASMIPVNNNIVCTVIGTTGEMESYSRAICGREKLQPSSVLKRGYVGGHLSSPLGDKQTTEQGLVQMVSHSTAN